MSDKKNQVITLRSYHSLLSISKWSPVEGVSTGVSTGLLEQGLKVTTPLEKDLGLVPITFRYWGSNYL